MEQGLPCCYWKPRLGEPQSFETLGGQSGLCGTGWERSPCSSGDRSHKSKKWEEGESGDWDRNGSEETKVWEERRQS